MRINIFTKLFFVRKVVLPGPKTFIRFLSHARRSDSKLVTMKLDTPYFHAIFNPEVNKLSELFEKHGYGLRIAGGAVRDLLMDKQPDDLDFATTATPTEMKKMFEAEGIRMLHRKGEAHGTVTIRLNEKQNFEITTLRIDTKTDGRHAEVEFTTDWELDAGRRDLTFNAMFLGLDGTIYDYFKGIEDLKSRKVCFVGDPDYRIKEDYLRILRYFRFYGRIAVAPDNHDAQTLEAVKKNADGLGKISGERLWTELKKILSGNYAKEIVLRMLDLGIGPFVGLPENVNLEEFTDVCERIQGLKPNPITRLSALLSTEDDVTDLHGRLKFSKYERDLAYFIINNKSVIGHPPLKPFILLIMHTKSKATDTLEWSCEVLKYRGEVTLLKELSEWNIPKFPISGHVLMERGYNPGPKMTEIMTALKDQWIESNFKLTKNELLDYVDKNVCGERV